jgi:CBS domain-containing protein
VDLFTNPTAQDVMTRDVICVHLTTSVRQLSELFLENNISGAPVTDDTRKVVGFVSQADIVELELHLQSDNSLESRMEETGGFVQDIMAPVEHVARENDSLATIIHTMCTERLHRLVVLDVQDAVCGIITTMDVMCYLHRIYQDEA